MKMNHELIGKMVDALVNHKHGLERELRTKMTDEELETALQMAEETDAGVAKRVLIDRMTDIMQELTDLEFDIAEHYGEPGETESKFTSTFTIAQNSLDEIRLDMTDDMIRGEG